LTIDIGGTGLKMIALDDAGAAISERQRELTPDPRGPEDVLRVLDGMLKAQDPFDRVSVGFPGVVVHGVVHTAPNLGSEEWAGFDLGTALAALTDRPTRVVNDADLQGYGVIAGSGMEMVITLGTGLGSALFLDGRLVPNLELGHHPLRKDKTYEELISDAELERIGKKRWRKRMDLVFETLGRIFNYERLYVGGGNARKLGDDLPDRVVRFDNVQGMEGGVALWTDTGPGAASQ
jgi:polyphosphate glucokinase